MNQVWIVDDDASIRWVLEKAFQSAGLRARTFADGSNVPERLARDHPDAIITDIRMPGLSGLELMRAIHTIAPNVPVIVMTAHTDLESAVASYQGGAFEYLPKPFDVDEAVALARRAIEQHREQHNQQQERAAEVSEIIGEAPAMQEVFRAIGRLANSNINVLIWGESGTGKELVARALHQHSPRGHNPLIAINTAAIPAELLESELFGHEKGAFTGAHSQRIGRFEQANGGTLFLDEIGDMPPELQTRLLRVLSDGRFYRVGGHDQVEVNVRILAATNQDLEQRVTQGRFREDLFHRLNVIRIALPALRDRHEDIPLLAHHFLDESARELNVDTKRLTPEAMEYLGQFDWPGNVRQLENICRWITVMAPGQTVSVPDLPDEVREQTGDREGGEDWEIQLRRLVERKLRHDENGILSSLGPTFERVLLDAALKHTGGHKQEAARRLGWGRNTLARKLKELGSQSVVLKD
jgi:two-component system nitrogen regulation response regulator GlnG